MADIRTCDHKPIGVDRIGRVGHQHRVTGTEAGQGQVSQPLLGTDGDNGLALGVQVHIVAVLVPVADGTAQTRDTLGLRVAVGVLALGHFDQLVDDVFGCRLVRISHAEVDNVLAPRSRRRFQLIDDVEYVRR